MRESGKKPMKNAKPWAAAALALLMLPLFTLTAWADSSWVWISGTRPVDVLPWVAAATILIESVWIGSCLDRALRLRVFLAVCLGNLVSFLAPYLFMSLENVRMGYSFAEALQKQADHWPSWIIGGGYLALTVLTESFVYFLFSKRAEQPRRLLRAFLLSNAVTTAVTFAAERLLCHGRW